MSATTTTPIPDPAPAPAPARKTNGHARTTGGRPRKTAAGKRAAGTSKPGAAIAAATAHLAPGTGATPQPLPEHRMPRTITGQIAKGAAAYGNSFMALTTTFVTELIGAGVSPTEKQTEACIAHFQTGMNLAREWSGPKAA
jgi:hypothetical protein